MKYIPAIIIVIMLFKTGGFCQDNNNTYKTGLFAKLRDAKSDTAKVLALIDIGYNVYVGTKPDSAIDYYNRALAIAKKANYAKGIFKYYACYGDILSMRGNYEQALDISRRQVALAESLKDKRMMGAAYNNIAGCYSDLGNIDKALEYYLKAITVYEERDDKKHLAAVYVNLLGISTSVGHPPAEALKYGLKAVEYCRAANNTGLLQEALLNVSYVYAKISRLNDAVASVTEAIAISRQTGDKSFLIPELGGLNHFLVKQGRFNLLKSNAAEMMQLAQQTGDKSGQANAAYYLALYEFNLKNYKAAEIGADNTLKTLRSGETIELREDLYTLLSDIALVKGNIAKYHTYRAMSDSLSDKYMADNAIKNMQEFEAKYKLNKKEAQIASLAKERQIQKLKLQKRTLFIIALFLVIVVMLIAGLLIRRNGERKNKLLLYENQLRQQQIQALEQEKELLSTQALLQGQERERSRLAKDLHDGLGGILTGTKYSLSTMKQNLIISAENAAAFEKTMNMLDQSITELRRVAHNMMPESLLKLSLDDALEDYCLQISNSGALQVTYQSFDIDNLVTSETVNITVYRVVQELINNVVKHAAAKSAIVQITFKEGLLGIAVEDDGKGIDMQALPLVDGMGYRNIKSRIDFLKGNIDIQSEKGKGTSVLIKIPV